MDRARRRSGSTLAIALGCLAALGLFCAGCVTSSSEPIYPADWPALVKSKPDGSVPDLTGTYRAVSEPAAPLEYPSGGRPQEWFFFVPIGGRVPNPSLGRRTLAWHLAGLSGKDDGELWKGLERFSAALMPDARHPDGREDLGWVRLSRGAADAIDVRCGVDSETILEFVLERDTDSTFLAELGSRPSGYAVVDGGVQVCSTFPASPAECSPGPDATAVGYFTFHPAADGSIVMLESLYGAPAGGEIAFQKWWRWRRIE